jgi:hypothetical protein
MTVMEMCPLHPDRRKVLPCPRYEIALCDHPDWAKCMHPRAVCNKRKFCEVWKRQGSKPR